jgi:hypothetical protein
MASLPPSIMDTASKATIVAPKMKSVLPASALPNWNNIQQSASSGR